MAVVSHSGGFSWWLSHTRPHLATQLVVPAGALGPCVPSSVVSKRQAEMGAGRGGAGEACFPFSSRTNGTTVNIFIHNLNHPGLKLTLSSFGVQYIISQKQRKRISIAQSFYT